MARSVCTMFWLNCAPLLKRLVPQQRAETDLLDSIFCELFYRTQWLKCRFTRPSASSTITWTSSHHLEKAFCSKLVFIKRLSPCVTATVFAEQDAERTREGIRSRAEEDLRPAAGTSHVSRPVSRRARPRNRCTQSRAQRWRKKHIWAGI